MKRHILTHCLLACTAALHAATPSPVDPTPESAPIPFSEIGAKATADYKGDAIGIQVTPEGAELRTGFQKLAGLVTERGLCLQSTEEGAGSLKLTAAALGRTGSPAAALPPVGGVSVADPIVRFTRPGLVEEFSVSVDGLRQDFIVTEAPAGSGALSVELALSGATAEAAAEGVKLTLDGSGRELAYNRLKVTDARGQALTAAMVVLAPDRLAVRVEDAGAVYPVRIDPTFSDADWVNTLSPGILGATGDVEAAVVDDNGNLYIGGRFYFVGSVAASRVAKWDGSEWSALGSGMDYFVYALAVSGTDLYAGGNFTTAGGEPANRIAKWDGSAWSALGSGMDNSVQTLAVNGTDLYAGGDFTSAGGVPATKIAKWDGSGWSALGSGMDNSVWALEVSGTDLYAGGQFTSAGGVPGTNRIAKWDGSAWSALGSGMDGNVLALEVSGTSLYAGGVFTTAGGAAANRIAKWDTVGNAWSALGSGIGGTVTALAVSGEDLYAGGSFFTAGEVPANRIAKWDGSEWSALGSGMGNYVSALAVIGSDLYAGGTFTSAGGVPANNIAKWDGSAWSTLGKGVNSQVRALAVSGTDIYAGGYFTWAGGVAANYIAKWDGSAWSALGSGMDDFVHALAVSGTDLYAGGRFTTAGGVPANYIAKWDGSAWSALGSGMDDFVNALAVSGTDLYAGGDFDRAGGVFRTIHIAKWDGSAWSALGTGMNATGTVTVNALAVSGTDLYAGGSFTTAGGVSANRVAKWDTVGNAWSALGSGIGGTVHALAVSGGDLYAGGYFFTAGGVPANDIAKWNGSAWSALGTGMNAQVHALVVSGTNLYAGGEFTTAGGGPTNRIARWNGSEWSALGTGVDNRVDSLAVDGNGKLVLGGYFTMAGTDTSARYIVQANLPPSPTISGLDITSGYVTGVTEVTITGTSFAGATAVTFGGTPATSFTVVNDTTITATAPIHASGVVSVEVTTDYGTNASNTLFTYVLPPVPAIASVTPNSGITIGKTSVTITGTDFTGATEVTFGGAAVPSFTVENDTTVTATTPAHAIGTVSVNVTTPGGTNAPNTLFTYVPPPAPTIASVSPNNGSTAGGTSVTITGNYFTGDAAVTVGGVPVADFTVVDDTTIKATTPAHIAGPVSVEVTTPSGTNAPNTLFDYVLLGPAFALEAYLKASNTDPGDVFGYSVAVSGDTAVIGAYGEDGAFSGVNNANQTNNSRERAGAVYVFTRSGNTWSQQAYLKASRPDTYDEFGTSVAVDGDTIVVGAPGEDSSATTVNGYETDNYASGSGAAYVFTRSDGTWTQQAYLKASNAEEGDSFGWSVAVSGDTVVVGAQTEDSNATFVNGNPSNNSAIASGAAYVFTRSGSTWSQQAYLKASNTERLDWFGTSVAVDGDTVVVGAYSEDSGVNGNQADNSAGYAGAAYVFSRSGGTWSQQAYLKASIIGAGDGFGISVALSGDTAVIGATGEDSTATDSGAAYVFTRSGSTWTQRAHLKASNAGESDGFGYPVAVSGDTAVIGASSEDSNATGVNGNQADNSASGSGAAYVFTRNGLTWSQERYLKASNTEANDQFGRSVAASGDTVIIAAAGEDSNAIGVNGNQADNSAGSSGAAYVFTNLTPEIEVSSPWGNELSSLSFGDTYSGFPSGTQSVTIRNTGLWGLEVSGVSLSGANPGDFVVSGFTSLTLPPQAHITFQVAFQPTAVGARSAILQIASDDADEGIFEIGLQGVGIPPAPEIAVQNASGTNMNDGASFGFGLVNVDGDAKAHTFTIRNVGVLDLEGVSVTLSGGSADQFAITQPPGTISPGASATFTASFDPTSLGSKTVSLAILSNDADENPFDLTLTGTGVPVISIADAVANEDDGTVVLTLTCTPPANGSKTVTLSCTNGTALATSDYTAFNGSTSVPNGASSHTIAIPLINNTTPEIDEYFTVNITGVSGAVVGDGQATVTIIDDDVIRKDDGGNLLWDNGTTVGGTSVYTHPNSSAGFYYFRIETRESAKGGWRTLLKQTSSTGSGNANLYLRRGNLPTTSTYDHRSILTGSDGLVLRPDQFDAGQIWYAMVEVTGSALWKFVTGEIYVEDLGALPFTDNDADGGYDIGEPIGNVGGVRIFGPEGILFFKQTVPRGTPAWVLWGGGTTNNLAVRRLIVPFPSTASPVYSGTYDKMQSGHMLVVPPYLGNGPEAFFFSVRGTPGTTISLDSRIQHVEDIDFGAADVAVDSTLTGTVGGQRSQAPYRTYRVNVPVNTLAWDLEVTPTIGDANVAVQKPTGFFNEIYDIYEVLTGVPNAYDNEGFSEVSSSSTKDSLTLVPPVLTDGYWYVTVYGDAPFKATLKQGNPVLTTIPFYSRANQIPPDVTNDQTDRVGWRYYQVRDILSQVGTLGWELMLQNQVAGTEIALRRNAIPGRWQKRTGRSVQDPTDGFTQGYVDHSSTNGLLQRPGHPADIWYVGVYQPNAPLGAFLLDRGEITPPPIGFDGTPESVTGHQANTWKFFRVDVPDDPDLLGWDVRLNATAGSPQLYVAREALPFANRASVSPGGSGWAGGRQWSAGNQVFGIGSGERLIASMGRPLEPGTYYIGVLASAGADNAYTVENRAIGVKDSGRTIEALADVAFDGGSVLLEDLPRGEPAYFKVRVDPGKKSWQVKLTETAGTSRLAVLRGALPNSGAKKDQPNSLPVGEGLLVEKTGDEIYQLLPSGSQTAIAEGDYWFAVIAETTTASSTFVSVGEMPVVDLGMAAETPTITPVALEGGEIKFYRFTVPANSAGFEVRLADTSGAPGFSIGEGIDLPYPFSSGSYGWAGGKSAFTQGTGIYSRVLNFNPSALTYTIAMRAASPDYGATYPAAAANLQFRVLPVTDMSFEDTEPVANHERGTWKYFKLTVPNDAALLGWDVWLRNVSGAGNPQLKVRRDLLPSPANEGESSDLPGSSIWPTGFAWPVGGDWTGRGYDGSRNVSDHRMMASLGRPLEPGIYYLAVYANDTTSYDVVSRGIGTEGSPYAVDLLGTLNATGQAAVLPALAPRDPAYVKVVVPAGQPSWRVRLTLSSGEAMMGVARGALPNTSLAGFFTGGLDDAGWRVKKEGSEIFHILPGYDQSEVPAGDYYFAIVGEGSNPPDSSTVGSETSSATFTNLGPLPPTDLGLVTTSPISHSATLTSAEIQLFTFTVDAGTPAIEVRLRNRSGNVGFSFREGTDIPTPFGFFEPRPSYGPPSEDYGFVGGKSAVNLNGDVPFWSNGIYTLTNPAAGTYTLALRVSSIDGIYSGGSANLEIRELPVLDLGFDGGAAQVTAQELGTWRFFRVPVTESASVLGWDLWLKDSQGTPQRMRVTRGELPPADLDSELINFISLGSSSWDLGKTISGSTDWTGFSSDPDGTYVGGHRLLAAVGAPLQAGSFTDSYYVGVYAGTTSSYNLTSEAIGKAGSGFSQEVAAAVPFWGGQREVAAGPREAQYLKVSVPPDTSSWQVHLGPEGGELMLAARQGGIPNGAPQDDITDNSGIKIRKGGEEFYHLLPRPGQSTIPAGDYYFAVIGEGDTPSGSTIGAGPVSGTFASGGPNAVVPFGYSLEVPLSAPPTVTVDGISQVWPKVRPGRIDFFNFLVPVGAKALEFKQSGISGADLRYSLLHGGALPQPNPNSGFTYGCDGGHDPDALAQGLVTLNNPSAGTWTVALRADEDGGAGSTVLEVRLKVAAPLNFAESQNAGNSGTHTDLRSLSSGATQLYEVEIPAAVNGEAVLGWRLNLENLQGSATVKVIPNFTQPTLNTITIAERSAILVPPYVATGETWTLEVRGNGDAEYRITSSAITESDLADSPWTMAVGDNLPFGDSGERDLGEDHWDFYAIDIPAGNLGLLRTELQAISGDPQLYLRTGGLPTLSHGNSGSGSLFHRQMTGEGTEYGNWVPVTAGTSALPAGRWYLGVVAKDSNVRYQLQASTRLVQELTVGDGRALAVRVTDGGSGYSSPPTVSLAGGGGIGAQAVALLEGDTVREVIVTHSGSGYSSPPGVSFSGGGGSGAVAAATFEQGLAQGDWRYYRVTLPGTLPPSWALDFGQVFGSSTLHLRGGAAPGQIDSVRAFSENIRNAWDDAGGGSESPAGGYPLPGIHPVPAPLMVAGEKVFIGFRADDDCVFTLESLTDGSGNNPPVFSGLARSTAWGVPLSIPLSDIINASTDPEGGVITVTAAGPTSAQGGTVALGATDIVYTPPVSFADPDTFTVTVSDALGSSATGTVTVTDNRLGDADGDGLSRADEEDLYGTSDQLFSSDGDAYSDGFELANGFDPLTTNEIYAWTGGGNGFDLYQEANWTELGGSAVIPQINTNTALLVDCYVGPAVTDIIGGGSGFGSHLNLGAQSMVVMGGEFVANRFGGVQGTADGRLRIGGSVNAFMAWLSVVTLEVTGSPTITFGGGNPLRNGAVMKWLPGSDPVVIFNGIRDHMVIGDQLPLIQVDGVVAENGVNVVVEEVDPLTIRVTRTGRGVTPPVPGVVTYAYDEGGNVAIGPLAQKVVTLRASNGQFVPEAGSPLEKVVLTMTIEDTSSNFDSFWPGLGVRDGPNDGNLSWWEADEPGINFTWQAFDASDNVLEGDVAVERVFGAAGGGNGEVHWLTFDATTSGASNVQVGWDWGLSDWKTLSQSLGTGRTDWGVTITKQETGFLAEKPFNLARLDIRFSNMRLPGTGGLAAFASAASGAGLTGADAEPGAAPFSDGVANLLKYAFNMNLAGPDSHGMNPAGTSGLPRNDVTDDGGQNYWRVEFVRRKNSGLIYTPKKSPDLSPGSWANLTSTPTVTSIDAEWERVVYEEPYDPAVTTECFTVVEVSLP